MLARPNVAAARQTCARGLYYETRHVLDQAEWQWVFSAIFDLTFGPPPV